MEGTTAWIALILHILRDIMCILIGPIAALVGIYWAGYYRGWKRCEHKHFNDFFE